MSPIQQATMTTAGLIHHIPAQILVGNQPVTIMAPVKLVIDNPSNGLQAPELRGKKLVFALPGGKELEVLSWI